MLKHSFGFVGDGAHRDRSHFRMSVDITECVDATIEEAHLCCGGGPLFLTNVKKKAVSHSMVT